jgi:ribosomal protein S18 acetylase RimI-like enzyme
LDRELGIQGMRTVDLKEEEYFIEQYVNLRNSYAELLLTSPVNIRETKEWLRRNDIEVRGFVQDDVLLGVVILYMHNDGEVACFVRYPNKGIGTELLKIIEEVAKGKKIGFIWAWVREDNFIAQRAFEKNGFRKTEISKREYDDVLKPGIKYKKLLGEFR